MRSDLIYDVGSAGGEDTAYYLHRGYNVFAIDANPLLIEQARLRFADEIAAGRLVLLGAGVAKTSGFETFWICDHPDWSSFDESIASRNRAGHSPIQVPVKPFSQILAEHGVPHYLKIDIEANDRLCIEALRGTELPKYLSVESECFGDAVSPSEADSVEMLMLLRDAGYKRFKLVNQCGWLPVRPRGLNRFCNGLVNGAAQRRPRWLAGIAAKFTDPARIANLGFDFAHGASGPWGEDIPGGWMTFKEARSTYLRERESFFSVEGRPVYSFWYDWHATY